MFAAVRGSVGVRTAPRGSDRVRSTGLCQFSTKHTRRVLSHDVLRQQKTGVMTKGGLTSLRLRRITSSPSQTLRRRLVRTTDDGRRSVLDACRRSSRLCFSHFATRTVDNALCSEARYSSRIAFLPTPPAFDAPVRGGGFSLEYRHPVWYGKN